MKNQAKPFVINYMMALKKENVSSFDAFFSAVSSNTGNAYITYSLIKEIYGWNCDFKGIKNIWDYDYSKKDVDLDYINSEATEVFLMLQDHIRPKNIQWNLPYEMLNSFLKRIRKPVFVIGIGMNNYAEYQSSLYKQLPENLKQLLYTIADKCPEIGCRGEYSQDILEKLGIKNSQPIGCSTFYENGINNYIKLSPRITIDDVVFTSAYKLGVFQKQPIILQSEEEIIKAILGHPKEMFRQGCYQSLMKAYEQKQYKLFSSVEEWKKFVSKYKFACGERVHGAVLSVNSGCPAVVLSTDCRSKEMANLLHLPYLPHLRNKDPLEIYPHLDYSLYNRNYNKLYNNYISFLNKNGLKINSQVNTQKKLLLQPSLNLYSNKKQYDDFNKKYLNAYNKLEIILLTYNRKEYLKKTLEQLFRLTSPIRDNYDITILDNASTDGTSELIVQYCKLHPRLKHIRHAQNIGGNANIIEAMKLAQREYVWILCDDDMYDWSYWYKVIEAMDRDEDVIVVERNFPSHNIPREIIPNELGFVPAAIYKTKLITSEVIQNAYINIYNSFPHLALVCDIFNKNIKISVMEHNIVKQGWCLKNDKEYVRGFNDTIHPKQMHVNLFLGYVASYQMLKDKSFRYKCCENLWIGKSFYYSVQAFLRQNKGYIPNLIEFYLSISLRQKMIFLYALAIRCLFFVVPKYKKKGKNINIRLGSFKTKIWSKHLLETFFSAKNSKNKKYKIITILGLKIKFKRHKTNNKNIKNKLNDI